MNTIQIQAQDATGNWRTFRTTINMSQYIRDAMKSVQNMNPTFRVRAVDENQRLVDIL